MQAALRRCLPRNYALCRPQRRTMMLSHSTIDSYILYSVVLPSRAHVKQKGSAATKAALYLHCRTSFVDARHQRTQCLTHWVGWDATASRIHPHSW
jgi:hypothetical protein